MSENPRMQVRHGLSTGVDLSRLVGPIGLAVAVGIVYFLAARLSLALLTKPEGVAVFWPAAGISAGVLIALGSGALWPVVLGTMAATVTANLLGDRNIWSAVLFALCNAGEAVLAAWLIGHYFGADFRLSKPRNVIGLAGAAVIAAAVSGIGGAITFRLFHGATTPLLTTWQHWFASDGLWNNHRCTAADRTWFGLARPATFERACRGRFGGCRACAGEWICNFPAVGAIGDRRTGDRVVRAAIVARRPLPSGFRCGRRVHREPFNSLDDDPGYWLFRQSGSFHG